MSIKIPITIVNELLTQAQAKPNNEICGLLGATKGVVKTCYPISNIAMDTKTQFEMSPQGQISAMKSMRKHNQELFAIYHSHPNTPAIPSDSDIKLNQYPNIFYLIISLDTKGILQLKAYQINQDKEIKTLQLQIY